MSNFPVDDPIYVLPPEEMIPEVMMLAFQLAESRDWGHTPLELEQCQAYADGSGVKVAILDTGVDTNHPDLKDRVILSRDFTGSSSGASDVQGHGTHCAGIVAASTDGNGIIGAAPKASILNGKVLGDNGSGASSGIAAGIRWATEQRADIISMSLGGPSQDSATRSAIQQAVASGIIVVCAAGNEGPREGTVGYPGGYDESICVGAVDQNLNAANFSSRGAALDIASPGVSILSTYPGGRYARLSGTSMATPYVAGCLALYLSYLKKKGLPLPSYSQVLDLFRQTAQDRGNPGKDTTYGWGFIKPLKMLQLIVPVPPPPPEEDFVELTSVELVAKGVKKVRVYF